MLVGGQFEYNFGDSEFLLLFLVLITLPAAASATLGAPASRPASGTPASPDTPASRPH